MISTICKKNLLRSFGINGFVVFALLTFVAYSVSVAEPFRMPSNKPPDQIRGEVNIWAWVTAAASLKEIIPQFNEQFPNVKVNIAVGLSNVQSRFVLSLAARVGAPDATQLNLYESQRYAATGRLMDLTFVAGRYEQNFAPSSWENCVLDGKVYAIPWDIGPCAVFYKRHIFERYGIDPNKIETWDDYIAAGKLILEKSNGATKMFHLPIGDLYRVFTMLLPQSGAQVFDDQGRVVINSAATLKIMTLLERMLQSGITSSDLYFEHAHYASLKNDTVATYPIAVWWGGSIKDYAPETSGDWGVFRLPAFERGGLRASTWGGSVLVIPDQCEYKEAIWAFVKFALCTTEAQILQYKKFDLFPAWLPAHQHPFMDEPDPFFAGQEVTRLFTQDIEKIPSINWTTDWPEAQTYLAQSLSKWAARGMGSPERMLAKLEKKMSRRLSREIAPSSLSLAQGD